MSDGVPGPDVVDYVRLVGVALVAVAVVVALLRLVRSVLRGSESAAAWRFDDLVLMALLGDLAFFVAITPTNDPSYVRYLTPVVVTGSILAARLTGAAVARLHRTGLRRAVAAAVAVLALYAVNVVPAVTTPVPGRAGRDVAAFLREHGLREGLGSYWVSALVTAASDDSVQVRPVIAEDPGGKIVRYGKQSTSAWYAGHTFQFLVWDTALPSFGVDEQSAVDTFGTPSASYTFRSYRIIAWKHRITVSSQRYEG